MTLSCTSTAPSTGPFRIAVYPRGIARKVNNPYFDLCHAALETRGVSASDDLDIDIRWLEARAARVDAVHLHWPEYVWREGFSGTGRLARAVKATERLLLLRQFLRTARRLGIQCIWTVHNMEPHEGGYRWDRYGYRLMARESDIVVCHSRASVEIVQRAFRPRGRVIFMPIGALGAAYPAPRPAVDVIRDLALDPQLPVVSCIGRLREYKGLDLACATAERLAGRVQTVIGGLPQGGFDVRFLRKAAESTPGLRLIERTLTDAEVADVTGASDAVLLPYREITGSAALLMALGLARGVVASDLPYFREILANEPDAGVVVPSRDPAVWAEHVLAYLAKPAEARRRAALRLAEQYSWDRCVESLVGAIDDVRGRRPARHEDVSYR
jgi:glycosyltransferase involved in cell wall biosynthesis